MLIRTGDDRKLIVKECRALIEEALDLGHAVPVLQRLQEIFDRHFKVEPPLRADPGLMRDPMPRLLRLFTQHLFIESHHNHVIKVVAKTRVGQHPDNIGEIIQLMFREELVMQVEAAEDHVHLCHVVVVVTMKGVVQYGDVRPRGIQQS